MTGVCVCPMYITAPCHSKIPSPLPVGSTADASKPAVPTLGDVMSHQHDVSS